MGDHSSPPLSYGPLCNCTVVVPTNPGPASAWARWALLIPPSGNFNAHLRTRAGGEGGALATGTVVALLEAMGGVHTRERVPVSHCAILWCCRYLLTFRPSTGPVNSAHCPIAVFQCSPPPFQVDFRGAGQLRELRHAKPCSLHCSRMLRTGLTDAAHGRSSHLPELRVGRYMHAAMLCWEESACGKAGGVLRRRRGLGCGGGDGEAVGWVRVVG